MSQFHNGQAGCNDCNYYAEYVQGQGAEELEGDKEETYNSQEKYFALFLWQVLLTHKPSI